MSFVNLHCHSHYSLLDGFGSPRNLVLRAKELGYPAVALTDHGVIHGLIELYKEAKKEGVKPILGVELYVAPRTRFDKESGTDRKPYHLTILAENNTGYKNILKLVTSGFLEGFYYKPRVDEDLLRKHSEGLIALSGCMAGHIPRLILSGNLDAAKKQIETYIDIFGKDNFFLEIQDHPLLENQNLVNEQIREFSQKMKIPMVLTFDSHYPRPEDKEVHDIMLCIQTGAIVSDVDRMRYNGDFSLKDVRELKDAYKDYPDVFKNSVKIADRCNVDFTFGVNLIPSFDTPNGISADDYLAKLTREGLDIRFSNKEIPQNYLDRLSYELKTVAKMGFSTYFLIVSDFVKYAKSKGIVVGPGRGSAAGSILAWCLEITELDPIKYGLFFERFLNPERVSMPDIDIDFADTRRDEVLNYVIEKYGRNNVAQILTFGTMAPRAAIRDVGRALGYPYQEVDKLSKTVPPPVLGKHVPLKESIKDDPALKSVYEKDSRARVLLDFAKKIEGTVRHIGTHACAVVISEKELTEYTALQYGARGEEIVTQFSAKPLEDLGLLKMDFLGLRNLTVIETTCEIVKRTRKVDIDIDTIALDDDLTFKTFQGGDTTGVFQFESPGMKRYLKQLKPTKFDDIIAMGALYRPGPMDWIPTYIKGKHNPEKVEYLHDSFKEILESTYGVAVYQEQILQLARDFAGFSLGEADILRKAVGKKIPALLAEQREKFLKGAVANGHKEKFAKEVFEKVVEPFAGYGFNKAHAACYAMIAYQTAYLKARYPIEFMTALLCSDANNTDRVVLEIKECFEMGIEVLPPSVNESFCHFTVVDDKTIRFGLLSVKGVGEMPIREIIKIRDEGGPFKSLEDFTVRIPSTLLNKKLIQALALSGAFDDFGDRSAIYENYEEISKFSKFSQGASSNGQTDIFGIMDDGDHGDATLALKDVPKFSAIEKLKWEKALLGMYVSGHPLKGLARYISSKASLIANLTKKHVNKSLKLVGIVSGFRKIVTKSGSYMAVFVLEDPTARVGVVMFPTAFKSYGQDLGDDMVISTAGKLDNKRGEVQFICDSLKPLSLDTMTSNAKEARVFGDDKFSGIAIRNLSDIWGDIAAKEVSENFVLDIPASADAKVLTELKTLLSRNRGEMPVELRLADGKKRVRLPFGIDLNAKLRKEIDSILS